MLNIGIVGAENSHTAAIAKVLNVEKRVRGVRVTHVWGETKAFEEAAAEAGQIPHIVKRPEDLIGEVKGLDALPVPISTPGFDSAPYVTA